MEEANNYRCGWAEGNNITIAQSTQETLMHCDCTQRPEIKQTGWGEPHAEWICPLCGQKYYRDKDKITKEKPFKWPSKKPVNFGI